VLVLVLVLFAVTRQMLHSRRLPGATC